MSVLEQFCLDGKVALVTGSTRGIGKAIARGLIDAGANVWLHGPDAAEGKTLAQAWDCPFVQADFTDPSAVASLADTIAGSSSQLDILVNNAGIEIIMPFERWDMQTFDTIWQVNTRAVSELTFRLLPLLKASRKASVINITSIHDAIPYPHNAAYSMSKAALAIFTKTIAVELAPFNIRMNNLAPGAVETEINRDVIEKIGREKFEEWIPLGRLASVDEMVGPALFLASDASRYMTGATLYTDGGYQQNLVRYRPK